jgi:hypothetical protein
VQDAAFDQLHRGAPAAGMGLGVLRWFDWRVRSAGGQRVGTGGAWNLDIPTGRRDRAGDYLTSAFITWATPMVKGIASQIAPVNARWVHCWVVRAPLNKALWA